MGAGLGVSGARGVIHSFIYLFFLIVILFHLLRFGFVIGVFLFYYFIFFLFRLIVIIIIIFPRWGEGRDEKGMRGDI